LTTFKKLSNLTPNSTLNSHNQFRFWIISVGRISDSIIRHGDFDNIKTNVVVYQFALVWSVMEKAMTESFEQELKRFFSTKHIPFRDRCDSFRYPDFSIPDPAKSGKRFYFDAKEKRQRYNMQNWQTDIPEEHFFIIDDLAARKILAFAPRSGIIIRNNISEKYHLFTVLDLFLMPKKRVNRPIHKNRQAYKGKWLVDLRTGKDAGSLEQIFASVQKYLIHLEQIFLGTLECYGNYGENIGEQGIVRRPDHWDTDVKATR